MAPNEATSINGLTRNGSAPSSLLATAVDGVMNPTRDFSTHHKPYSRFFPSEATSLTSDQSTGNISGGNNTSSSPNEQQNGGINVNTTIGLQRNYGLNHHQEGNFGIVSSAAGSIPSSSTSSPLVRHSSSPAGLLNQLAHASGSSNDDNGFPTNRTRNLSRLNTQLSFTRPHEALTQISEEQEDNVVNDVNRESSDPRKNNSHSHVGNGYEMGPWDLNPGSVMISMGPSKGPDNITADIVNTFNAMESQFQFGMQGAIIGMSPMEKLLNIPQDSVPCKIRAKRGFATHPRSIAERERRTRISGKLKKLQDLVPNMDKQTSYADMLDLAVQHIQGLQNQVQMLDKELENCTCDCKRPHTTGREENR